MFNIKYLSKFENRIETNEPKKDELNPTEPKRLGLRLWMAFGHIFFCSQDRLKLNSSFISADFDCNLKENSLKIEVQLPIQEVFTRKINLCPQHQSLVCFIVLVNGEVQSYLFNGQEHAWEKYCFFNVANETNCSRDINSVVFDESMNFIVWCEGQGSFDYSLYYRQVSSMGPHVVLDLCNNGVPVKIISQCYLMHLNYIGSTVSCLFRNSKDINLFLTFSLDTKTLSIHTTKGITVLKSERNDASLTDILFTTIGLWSNYDTPVFQYRNSNQEKLYILTKKNCLLSINEGGVINSIITLKTSNEDVLGFVVYANIACLFSACQLNFFCIKNGLHLETMFLLEGPILNIWFCNESLSAFGFYTNKSIYRVLPSNGPHQTLKSVFAFNGDPDCELLFKLYSVLSKLPLEPSMVFMGSPLPLQSEALLLALLQNSRDRVKSGVVRYSQNDKVTDDTVSICSRLNKLLLPLVDSFYKLDSCRLQLLDS